MEDYAAKMALKSDAALRQYATDYAQYREEAVLAAFDELRRRGQPAPEEDTLRPQLEAIVQQNQATAAAQAATEAEAAKEAELPRLYSPTGIVVMSAMVSVVAGAVLLGLNMYWRKRSKAIIGLAALVAVYLVIRTLALKWMLAHNLVLPAAFLIDLPIIIAYVWWFWPRYVGTYQFQPRNWLLPLGACVLAVMAFLLLNPTTAQQIKQQMEQIQKSQQP